MVIGDVMVDSYLIGKVERISPEAPIPIVGIQSKESRLGGAANVALNLQSLGASPLVCSVIGDDQPGKAFREMLREAGIRDEFLLESSHRTTSVKTRVISNKQQLLRFDEEVTHTLNEKIEQSFLELLHLAISEEQPAAIIFQDYDKGVNTPVVIEEVIQWAHQHNIPVLVDPKKKNFLRYREVKLFKPNLKELKEGLKLDFWTEDLTTLHQISKRFMADQQIEIMVVTLSEKGIFACTKEDYVHFPAHPIRIADVSGAGDTVISLLALALSQEFNLADAAELANLGGSLVCTQAGVVPISPSDLLQSTL